MFSYEETKRKCFETLNHGALAYQLAVDRETRRKVLNDLIKVAQAGLELEDIVEELQKAVSET